MLRAWKFCRVSALCTICAHTFNKLISIIKNSLNLLASHSMWFTRLSSHVWLQNWLIFPEWMKSSSSEWKIVVAVWLRKMLMFVWMFYWIQLFEIFRFSNELHKRSPAEVENSFFFSINVFIHAYNIFLPLNQPLDCRYQCLF